MTRGRGWVARGVALGAGGVAVATLGFAAPAVAVDTDMTASATTVAFGEVQTGGSAQLAVTLTNTGGSPFGPVSIFGGAPPTPEFTAGQTCQSQTIAAGGSCQITYIFTPDAAGTFSDTSRFTLSQTTNQADGEDFTVALAGTGCEMAVCAVTTTTTATTAPVAETPMAPQGQTPEAPVGLPTATTAGQTPGASPPGAPPDAGTPPPEAGTSPADTGVADADAEGERASEDDEVAVADLDDGSGSGGTWLLVASIALVVLALAGGAVALAYQRGRTSGMPPPRDL